MPKKNKRRAGFSAAEQPWRCEASVEHWRGQPLSKAGASPRANQQVNALNKAAGYDKYSAIVKEAGIPGRQAALDAERAAVKDLRANGNRLPLQKRPE